VLFSQSQPHLSAFLSFAILFFRFPAAQLSLSATVVTDTLQLHHIGPVTLDALVNLWIMYHL
jgi:hypothetical protein